MGSRAGISEKSALSGLKLPNGTKVAVRKGNKRRKRMKHCMVQRKLNKNVISSDKHGKSVRVSIAYFHYRHKHYSELLKRRENEFVHSGHSMVHVDGANISSKMHPNNLENGR